LQKKNVDADEWTVNMAAGVCLASVAQVVKDDVVQYVMPFVEANITAQVSFLLCWYSFFEGVEIT
jgi:hypothetical protein